MKPRSLITTLLLLALAVAYGLTRTGTLSRHPPRHRPSTSTPHDSQAASSEGDEAPAGGDATPIEEAIRRHADNVWVEVAGTVDKRLPTDTKGARHQRFLLRLGDGTVVLVAHNIDVAPEVPLSPGDRVEIRGEYKWNAKGGLLHWTHHDRKDRHPGGWIKLAGQVYR